MSGIPWSVILRNAPQLMKLAEGVLVSSRDRSANIAAGNDARAVREQLAELATDQQAHAALLNDLTGQLQAIAVASQAAADKAAKALLVGGMGLVLGLVALLVALLR
jgi:hypothetical protein